MRPVLFCCGSRVIASCLISSGCTGFQFGSACFIVAILVHWALSVHVPSYLADDCCLVTDARPKRLCSADTLSMLLVSRTRTNFGDRAFSASGPLESGTICQRTSDSWICHTASRWRRFHFRQWNLSAVLIVECPPFNYCALEILLLMYGLRCEIAVL